MRTCAGKFESPTKCIDKCRSRSFEPDRSSAQTIDLQRIKIQELSDDAAEAGRVPRSVECELTDDLVDMCIPGGSYSVSCTVLIRRVSGDVVTLGGIVRQVSVDTYGGGRAKSKSSLFLLFLEGVSLNNSQRGDGSKIDSFELNSQDMYLVATIAHRPNLFPFIVQSICPSIYGQELVKAGLALTLFGGSAKFSGDKNKVHVRGDPHILVVGDPGLGKSQMLKAASSGMWLPLTKPYCRSPSLDAAARSHMLFLTLAGCSGTAGSVRVRQYS